MLTLHKAILLINTQKSCRQNISANSFFQFYHLIDTLTYHYKSKFKLCFHKKFHENKSNYDLNRFQLCLSISLSKLLIHIHFMHIYKRKNSR